MEEITQAVSIKKKHIEKVDEGLKSYMLKVYNYMCLALIMTGLTAYGVSLSPELISLLFGTPFKWVVILAPLGFVFFLSAKIHSLDPAIAKIVFWIYSIVTGLSLSFVFLAYTGTSIAQIFFITAGAFAGLSLFGYTTKINLGPIGAALTFVLIGLIIASIVNIFLGLALMQTVISLAGVVVFAGLTASDTQNIKNMYLDSDSVEDGDRKAISGALSLYLSFMNLFILLLDLIGVRK